MHGDFEWRECESKSRTGCVLYALLAAAMAATVAMEALGWI